MTISSIDELQNTRAAAIPHDVVSGKPSASDNPSIASNTTAMAQFSSQQQLQALTATTPQQSRRSILPMRYQNSSESLQECLSSVHQRKEDELFTISPQSATLFPTSSSTLSFQLPPQAPSLLVPSTDKDGYTHSFYDLKATAVVRTATTNHHCMEPKQQQKPFWENLIRLLPWVQDDPTLQQQDKDTSIKDGAMTPYKLQAVEDPTSNANSSSEGSISSVDEDNDTSEKSNTKATTLPKRPSSILRRSRFSSERMAEQDEPQPRASSLMIPSSTDIPLLVSDSDSSISSSCSSQVLSILPPPPQPARRCVSVPTFKRATFDPRICIRQFNRSQEELKSTWFSPDELCNFRKEALQRILQTKSWGQDHPQQRAVFTHHALSSSSIQDEPIQDILIVDAHDICANLFAMGLSSIFPDARILKARSTGEATVLCQRHSFDMMVVEERLKMFHRQESPASGSCLLKTVRNAERTLLVGVSAHLAQDASKLKTAGADLLWTKPPPRMDDVLRKTLLKAIGTKRHDRTTRNIP